MARRVLPLIPMVCAAILASGCPYPPPLDVESSDAGASSPPVILGASPAEFQFPGPVQLHRGENETRQFAIDISDNDAGDQSFVRMYVDYGVNSIPTPFLSDCTAAGTEGAGVVRTAFCPAAQLCSTIPTTDTDAHALEVLVADRPFLSAGDPDAEGQPPFRAVALGGSSPAIRSWVMRCDP